MPAYFSLDVIFQHKKMKDSFVEEIYSIFQESGFIFKCGYWDAKDLTLDEIIKINTRLLNEKFELGYTQHFSEGYKQVIFEHHDLKVRLFWMMIDDEVLLSINIPEYDVLHEEEMYTSDYKFKNEVIDVLFKLAQNIWNLDYADIIQTCLELEDHITINQLSNGIVPSINPFCITRQELYGAISNKIIFPSEVRELKNDGVSILRSNLVK